MAMTAYPSTSVEGTPAFRARMSALSGPKSNDASRAMLLVTLRVEPLANV